ncbi:amidase signature domain-containing protein [Hypomontagnella monticulosa]|nr:amidase signature domain-containing protein [Hypomontagnella monticulosa]
MMTTIHIGDCDFALQPEVYDNIEPPGGLERLVSATVLDIDDDISHIGDEEFEVLCRELEGDDVWMRDFLNLVILQCSNRLTTSRNMRDRVVVRRSGGKRLPRGPHVVDSRTGGVYGVFKLFEDTTNAFVGGTILEFGTDRYKWLASLNRMPVPSKLCYDRPSNLLHLSGMRFGVKDSIDITGLETGCGSQCYKSLYPAKSTTAEFINHLISAGAIMVGKMRCTQWCDGQDPLERLEEVSPTNPRGDAFQKPSSSSSGSASGAASYPWLDFTVGTDTGGSIRHPAGVNGLYGVRPSHGSVGSSGLVCSQFMDTPGVFARSAAVARAVIGVMTRKTSISTILNPKNVRYKILYAVEPDALNPSEIPKFFPRRTNGSESQIPADRILEGFVKKLEKYLHCERCEVCIYDLWKDTRPTAASESLVEATGMIYQNIVYYELWHNTVNPFVQEYQATHSGQMPFIEAITKARLDYGSRVSKEDYDESVVALKTYATWVNEVLLPPPSTSDTGITTIPLLIYPQTRGLPNYRDEVVKRKDDKDIFWHGFSVYSISYCSGCPDITVPVGEVKFYSKITQKEEYLPVAVSLLAPRGEDEALLRLVAELEESGVLRPVECGPRLWND